jgi:hypothetical protein
LKNKDDDGFLVAESSGRITFFDRESDRRVLSINASVSPLQDADWSSTNPERIVAFVDGRCLIWRLGFSTLPEYSNEVSTEVSGLTRSA